MTFTLWFFAFIGASFIFSILFVVTLGLVARRLERKGRSRGNPRVDR